MSGSIYTSPDFQSDQTEGFPASLCWDWDENKAWLELNDSLAESGEDLSHYEQLCRDFGERPCFDSDDFNALLEELGEDAVRNATISDEPEEFGGMTL